MVRAFDADYAWPMMATLNRVLMEGAGAGELRRTWEEEERRAFPRGTVHLHCTDNHDEAWAISRFGWNGALASSAMMLALDGVPLLYNGMEVGDATESGDPALFERVPIFWQPKGRDSFRETYRQLIALRREHPALRGGSVDWLGNSAPGNVVSFLRKGPGEEMVVIVNFSNRPQAVDVQVAHAGGFSAILRGGNAMDGRPPVLPSPALGAYGWAIFRRALSQ
jgi:glycosidase